MMMIDHGNNMPIQQSEELHGIVSPKEKLPMPKKMGGVILNDLIGTTFSIANDYVRMNKDLISYDVQGGGPRILQFDELTGDYMRIDVYNDADKAWNLEMKMNRGVFTRYDNYVIDFYDLNNTKFGGLFHYSRGYETNYIEKDYTTGDYNYGRGIGPKRQARAIGVLALMQSRLRDLLDEKTGL